MLAYWSTPSLANPAQPVSARRKMGSEWQNRLRVESLGKTPLRLSAAEIGTEAGSFGHGQRAGRSCSDPVIRRDEPCCAGYLTTKLTIFPGMYTVLTMVFPSS